MPVTRPGVQARDAGLDRPPDNVASPAFHRSRRHTPKITAAAVTLAGKPLDNFQNRCAIASRGIAPPAEMHGIHSPRGGRFAVAGPFVFNRKSSLSGVDCAFVTVRQED